MQKQRVKWVNGKCAAEANDGKLSQTMVTINKDVFFYSFHRVDVNPKYIKTGLCQKIQNESNSPYPPYQKRPMRHRKGET